MSANHNIPVPNVGHLCAPDARRDAIHVAVAPVVAAGALQPGQRVGILPDGTANIGFPPEHAVGLVDPYLSRVVEKGETFWLFLYPNTITSLRHVWTHPEFKAQLPTPKERDHAP